MDGAILLNEWSSLLFSVNETVATFIDLSSWLLESFVQGSDSIPSSQHSLIFIHVHVSGKGNVLVSHVVVKNNNACVIIMKSLG